MPPEPDTNTTKKIQTGPPQSDRHYVAWSDSGKLSGEALKFLAQSAAWYWADKRCGYGREKENGGDIMRNFKWLGLRLD